MVYYLSTRRSDDDSMQYAMDMSLDNLQNNKVRTPAGDFPGIVVLLGIPIATLILFYILLAIFKPGMCCNDDEKYGKVFSPKKAFGISFVVAAIAFAGTYFYMKTKL